MRKLWWVTVLAAMALAVGCTKKPPAERAAEGAAEAQQTGGAGGTRNEAGPKLGSE